MTTEVPVVVRAAPVSPGQQRMLKAELEAAGHAARHVEPVAVLVKGGLDLAALQKAVDTVVERQEALRVTLRLPHDSPPVQLITRRTVPIVVHDLTRRGGEPVTAPDAVSAITVPPIRSTDRDLFRVDVAKLAAELHVVMFRLHHLVSDGWSYGVMFRELSEGYAAALEGRTHGLPTLTRGYADLCVRADDRRRRGLLVHQLDYWTRELAGPWRQIDLPLARPKTTALSQIVADESLRCPPELVASLRAAAQGLDVRGGLAGPMLAAVALVLFARSGATDVRVGTMVSNRTCPDAEHAIGFFANLTVIRLVVDADTSLRSLVNQANAKTAAALANQEVPIQDVIEQLYKSPSFSPYDLYQVQFVLNTMRQTSLRLPGARCVDVDIAPPSPRRAPTTLDLRWEFTHFTGHLNGKLTYRTDVIDASQATGYVASYTRALGAVGRRSDELIGAVAATL